MRYPWSNTLRHGQIMDDPRVVMADPRGAHDLVRLSGGPLVTHLVLKPNSW